MAAGDGFLAGLVDLCRLIIHFGSEGMTVIDRDRKADPEPVTGNRRDKEPDSPYGPPQTPT
jgi:hypothetical protein